MLLSRSNAMMRFCQHVQLSMLKSQSGYISMTSSVSRIFSTSVDASHVSIIKMPSIMDSVDGTVLEWLKHEGENVSEGESICRVEVGDLLLEIEAPFNGIIADKLVEAHCPTRADSDVVVVCDSHDSYMSYFEAARIAAHEAEMVRILEESKAERNVRPSAGIVLREVRHLIQEGKLDAVKDADFVNALQTLARKGDPELLTVFDASFEGLYFNVDTFNSDYFLEQARHVVADSA